MLAAWVCAGLLFGPAEAEAEAARAKLLAADGKHGEAADAFGRAYEQDPQPVFLFARARSEQRAERYREAIELYSRFLDTHPPASDVAVANKHIGECYTALEKITTPPAVVGRELPPEQQVPERPIAPTVPRRWHRDPTGGVLLGIGAAAIGAGSALVIAGLVRGEGADSAPTTEAFRERTQGARRLSIAGVATLAGGIVFAVGAVVRYTIVARATRSTGRAPTPPTRVGVSLPFHGLQLWF